MTHKNSDNLFESLSALMDDEASELELHRILKHIETNEELREHWERYHMISSIMRKDREYTDSEGSLFARVSEAVSQEATYGDVEEASVSMPSLIARSSSQQPQSSVSWTHFVGKAAVAASFAAAVVFMSPALQQVASLDTDDSLRDEVVLASQPAVVNTPSVTTSAPAGFSWNLPEARTVNNATSLSSANLLTTKGEGIPDMSQVNDPELQSLLNDLLVEHAHRASQNGGVSILPYARVSRLEQSLQSSSKQ